MTEHDLAPMPYVGQTRSASLIDTLKSFGIGECTVRGELPPRRFPYIFDNGAYRDWIAGRPFDHEAWGDDVWRIRNGSDSGLATPSFLVLPDKVAGGNSSLEFSHFYYGQACGAAPIYLPIQDGMHERLVGEFLSCHEIDGLFIGGTVEWKLREGERWVVFGHSMGLPVHIGRVGTAKRVRWAFDIGADSIDSCLPLWSKDNLRSFLTALSGTQLRMFSPRSGVAKGLEVDS